MVITVNKKKYYLPEGTNVLGLLKQLKYSSLSAVWVNDCQLLYEDYRKFLLKEGDQVRIIRPLGGG
ncbi:MAG: sulfur carrier protein ThiS [Bacillota bacterium]|jgi:thiamine biosynthesis protein ThiS